jgi:8-oxo-dGTP pyrophosphatase MutT (NUDIX family)
MFQGVQAETRLSKGRCEGMRMLRDRHQTAALPLARDGKGRLTVLMVTSRDTGRWIVPKGWLMDDATPWHAAAIEALEEAGAKGFVGREGIGDYTYDKRLDDGSVLSCHVRVYPMRVEKLKRTWKERGERKRRWFSPEAAARRVQEPELAALLRRIEREARRSDSALGRVLDAL